MNVIHGDLIALARERKFDTIVHGCNCMHMMNAGIAKQIREAFPTAYSADLRTTKGDRRKLGTVSQAFSLNRDLLVVNGYTQFDWRGPMPRVDLDALRSVMSTVAATWPNAHIGYPRIGAGLAGGDWNAIRPIIEEELDGMNHTLVEYTP